MLANGHAPTQCTLDVRAPIGHQPAAMVINQQRSLSSLQTLQQRLKTDYC
jgi:hypothetical protein